MKKSNTSTYDTLSNNKTKPKKTAKRGKYKFKFIKNFKSWWRGMPKWLRIQVPVFATMGVLLLSSIVTICVMPSIEQSMASSNGNKTTRSGLPTKMVAPFVDMSSWVNAGAYSVNGAPNLGKFAEDTGIKYYNLGFINPLTNYPLKADGTINWGWGGYSDLTKNSTSAQYKGIVQSIQNLVDAGGIYTISFGGQIGDAPWRVIQNVDRLADMYLDVINTYKLKRIDLDIEESNQDADQNRANAKAIKKVQDKTNVEVVLTIPIMPNGWEQKQLNIINAYLMEGVDIILINSMCMCYGTGVYAGEDYGDASVRAIENSIKQLKKLYGNYGYDLSDTQAYQKTGCTVSIGYESTLYPTFTTNMMKKVTNHAKAHNYGMLSFWSMGRDSTIDGNKGISTKYAYTNIAKEYLNK